MRRVAISSAATSRFSKATERPIFDIACEPCFDILKESGKDVDAVLFSTCATEQYSSTIMSEMLGLKPKVSQRIDNLCNSGTNAIGRNFTLRKTSRWR